MKILNSINEYINDDKCKLVIFENSLYVSHYTDIKSFDSNKFMLEIKDKIIVLLGKNISIKKLTKNELLVSGNIETIEFRW